MRLKQFEENAFDLNPRLLDRAMDSIAGASHGAFSGQQLRCAIEEGTHAGFYYCTDDLDVMGVIVVTKLINAMEEHVMVVVGASGRSLGEWEDANKLLSELGKALGCIGIEIKGRRGFMGAFKHMGWTEQYVSMYRPIED